MRDQELRLVAGNFHSRGLAIRDPESAKVMLWINCARLLKVGSCPSGSVGYEPEAPASEHRIVHGPLAIASGLCQITVQQDWYAQAFLAPSHENLYSRVNTNFILHRAVLAMKIYVGQIYIEPGVRYPFTHHFQKYLSDLATADVASIEPFCREYGEDYDVVFNMSAKAARRTAEIKGPTVFKRGRKTVEYSIFLPFAKQGPMDAELLVEIVRVLLSSMNSVLNGLGMSTNQIANDAERIAQTIVGDPRMTKLEQGSKPR